MTTTKTLQVDPRQIALENCENNIQANLRRGLEATRAIAKELIKIQKEELYTAVGIEDFGAYLAERTPFDQRTFHRISMVGQTCAYLQEAGLQLPANETQIVELNRLEVNRRAEAWNALLIKSEKEEVPLTVEAIRAFVDKIAAEPAKPAPPATGGIEVEMGDSNGEEPKTKPKIQEGEIRLTEKGEAALARIRKVCGGAIADSIENGSNAMTEREIRGWADKDDSEMKSLVYYLIDQRWTLNKAVNFISKDIQPSTDVEDLLLIARARGGTASLNVEGAKITVEIT
jgi:hypothetical protein